MAYEIKEQAPYVPTPVTHGELMFLWADKSGVVTCINAADGKQVWQKRVGGAYYGGSPVRAGDKLFCVDEAGIVVCLAAGPEFKELGRTELGEDVPQHPRDRRRADVRADDFAPLFGRRQDSVRSGRMTRHVGASGETTMGERGERAERPAEGVSP